MIEKDDLKHQIVEPVLWDMGMYSEEAVELLMGTAAQESHLTHRRQIGGGPALGYFQMEPATAEDIVFRYLPLKDREFQKKVELAANEAVMSLTPDMLAQRLEDNVFLMVALARLKYYMVPEAIPKDLHGQAAYWKRWYNTPLGAGTTEEYMTNYINVIGEHSYG